MTISTKASFKAEPGSTDGAPAGGHSEWFVANSDASTTADPTSPDAIAATVGQWIPCGSAAARVIFRSRTATGGTVTTDPVVRIVTFDGADPTDVSKGGEFTLLPDVITVTQAAVSDDDDGGGATYDFGEQITNGGEGFDLWGAPWFAVIPTTAADTTSATTEIEAKVLR